MTMWYTPAENRWAQENRAKKEAAGIALVECSDGVWRTVEEREAWNKIIKLLADPCRTGLLK